MYKIFTNKNNENGSFLTYSCYSFKDALDLAQNLANDGYKSIIKKDNNVIAKIEN